MFSNDGFGSLDAVKNGHADVHHHYIRFQRGS
jgi:hypothetical protein